MEAPSQESVLVLDEDRALGDVVPPEALERARRASVAAVLSRPAGPWGGGRDSEIARGGFGLLLLDGLLVRRVGVGGRFGAELLAAGDLLRPWQHDGAAEVLPFEMAWRIVAPGPPGGARHPLGGPHGALPGTSPASSPAARSTARAGWRR